MNDIERKKHNLLVYLLEQINDAVESVDIGEKEMSGLYTINFRYMPIFELDEEDIEVIKDLAEYEPACEDLTELIKSYELEQKTLYKA